MTKDEILRYIILCVSYKHNNDISPYITKSSEEKEDLLFESAIEFLEKLDKENAELNKELKAEKEYSATLRKEIDEYTNSHTLCAKYKKLEEENAELKEEMKAKQVVLNDFKSRVETVTDRFNKKSSQLTKAKELLRMVIDSYFHKERFSFEKDLRKAEQFLKEE